MDETEGGKDGERRKAPGKYEHRNTRKNIINTKTWTETPQIYHKNPAP